MRPFFWLIVVFCAGLGAWYLFFANKQVTSYNQLSSVVVGKFHLVKNCMGEVNGVLLTEFQDNCTESKKLEGQLVRVVGQISTYFPLGKCPRSYVDTISCDTKTIKKTDYIEIIDQSDIYCNEIEDIFNCDNNEVRLIGKLENNNNHYFLHNGYGEFALSSNGPIFCNDEAQITGILNVGKKRYSEMEKGKYVYTIKVTDWNCLPKNN